MRAPSIRQIPVGHYVPLLEFNPYWSAQGKAYASIEEAAARGEITPEDAIAAYRRLADAAAK